MLLAHIIGLLLGAGVTLFLDVAVIRYGIRANITHEMCDIMDSGIRMIKIGLVILWITGASFLLETWLIKPEAIFNPKVFAKITIVTILTLNGMLVHRVVYPTLRKNIGNTLFYGVSIGRQRVIVASGAVSMTSWAIPILFGTLQKHDFKDIYTLGFLNGYVIFFGFYLLALLFALMMSLGLRDWIWSISYGRSRKFNMTVKKGNNSAQDDQ